MATPFLTATHTQVGDTIVLTDHGTQITVRIVGEVFNIENRGMQILTAAATLAAAEPDLRGHGLQHHPQARHRPGRLRRGP